MGPWRIIIRMVDSEKDKEGTIISKYAKSDVEGRND